MADCSVEQARLTDKQTDRAAGGEMPTHIGAVEEVADGKQRGQDIAERLILLQLLHAFFQVLHGLSHFLRDGERAPERERSR